MRTANVDAGTAEQPDPPQSAEAVLARLAEGFEDLPEQLQVAARFLLDRPREVGVQSMRALAAQAEVHPNTLVRLAQALGFDGWDALRGRFRDFLVSGGMGGYGDRARWLQELSARGGTADVVAGMARASATNLEEMWGRQDPGDMQAAADAILGARRVFVLGMGSAYALAHQFWYVARMALDHIAPIPRHGSHPIDDLSGMTADDVLMALTFQPYRAETMDAARRAADIGASVIAVTDCSTSPLARVADHKFFSPTHTPQFFHSQAAATALLETMVAVLVARAGPEATGRIEAFHQRRLEAGLYEEAAPLAQLK